MRAALVLLFLSLVLPAARAQDDGPKPGDVLDGSTWQKLKVGRATVAGIKSSATSGFDSRIVFDPSQFALESLSRYGK